MEPRFGDGETGWKGFNLGLTLELQEQQMTQRGKSDHTEPVSRAKSSHSVSSGMRSLGDLKHRLDEVRSVSQKEHSGRNVE